MLSPGEGIYNITGAKKEIQINKMHDKKEPKSPPNAGNLKTDFTTFHLTGRECK